MQSLVTSYKSLKTSYITFDETYNKLFHVNSELIQYNALFGITGAIQGTLNEKFDKRLGLQSFQSRRWFCKLCFYYKIYKNQSLHHFHEFLRLQTSAHIARSGLSIRNMHTSEKRQLKYITFCAVFDLAIFCHLVSNESPVNIKIKLLHIDLRMEEM